VLPIFFVPAPIIFLDPLEILLFVPCFTAGIVAFDLTRSCKTMFRLPAWVWPIGIVGTMLMFRPYDTARFSERYAQGWALALAVGLLYPFVSEAPSNWLYKGCHWVAERSYGIYLSHAIVLWIVFDRLRSFSPWIQIPVLIVGVLGIPAFLYPWFEKPLIQLGVQLANRVTARSRMGEVQMAVEL
jgi:peptidoglycan/LPS O-acetylase OafA/YrhL